MDIAQFFIGTENRVELFGPLHIALSAAEIAAALALYFLRGRLKRSAHKRAVRYVMAGILAGNMLVHYLSKIILGIWRFEYDLPFHLCFITNFFMIYILLTDNKHKLYRVVYFFTFIGPLPAMIWPDLRVSWDSYTFYQFIISHHFMLLFSLYCLFVLEYEVTFKNIIPTFFIGNGLVAAMAVFNYFFHTNYIMITGLPEQLYEIYPFLYALPPIFWLELVGILAMLAAYIPALIRNRSLKRGKKIRQA